MNSWLPKATFSIMKIKELFTYTCRPTWIDEDTGLPGLITIATEAMQHL